MTGSIKPFIILVIAVIVALFIYGWYTSRKSGATVVAPAGTP